jgi:hypothetical protein
MVQGNFEAPKLEATWPGWLKDLDPGYQRFRGVKVCLGEVPGTQLRELWPHDLSERMLAFISIYHHLSTFIHPSIHPFTHGSNHPFVVDLTTQSWSDSQGGRLTKDGEWWLGESSPNTNDLIFSLLNYFEFSKIYGFIMRVLSQIPSR